MLGQPILEDMQPLPTFLVTLLIAQWPSAPAQTSSSALRQGCTQTPITVDEAKALVIEAGKLHAYPDVTVDAELHQEDAEGFLFRAFGRSARPTISNLIGYYVVERKNGVVTDISGEPPYKHPSSKQLRRLRSVILRKHCAG